MRTLLDFEEPLGVDYPKFLTNFPKEEESLYRQAIKEAGMEEELVIEYKAQDRAGRHMPDHLSLWRIVSSEDADLAHRFWPVFNHIQAQQHIKAKEEESGQETRRYRLFTLKGPQIMMLEWYLIWTEIKPPTLEDFKNKYGDGLYLPFHKNSIIVEFVEQESTRHTPSVTEFSNDDLD